MPTLPSPARLTVAVVAAAAAVFLLGAVLAPLAASTHGWGVFLQLAYRPACHQIPARCLDLGAGPMAVCARCAGLYLGGVLGLTAVAVLPRPPRPGFRALALVAVPSILDFGSGLVGLPATSNLPRLGLAVPLGLVLGLLVGHGVAEIVRANLSNRPRADSVE